MSWGADQLEMTEATFQMAKAATAGVLSSTSIAGVDLQDLISWVPVDTPFFDTTPRKSAKQGAKWAFWQVLLNVNDSQPDGGVEPDAAADVINIENQYVYSPFAIIGAGGRTTWDAEAQAQGYADALAVDTLQTINQQLINLDIHQLLAQNFPLPAASTPTLAASSTGGSIASGASVSVQVAARSGLNYYRGGGSGVASTAASVTAGTSGTSSVTASVTAVKGAVAYDWYVGGFYYTTTTVNTVTITSVPTSTQNVPKLAGIYQAGQPGPGAVPTADTSYKSIWQNGLLPSIVGDFASNPDQIGIAGSVSDLTTPGTGTPQGAYYQSLDGGQLVVSGAAVEQIDDMNRSIYDTWRLTPTRMLVGSQIITDLANALLDNPQAVTWLQPADKIQRGEVVLGGAVALYLNKTVNGKPITLELQPHLPPGTLISVVDQVPFPGANITTALEVETLYDFFRFDYGANRGTGAGGGPRWDFEIRTEQAFKNKASAMMGVIQNVAPGIAA